MDIKREYLPQRCEVCHQSDLFDAQTGRCQRCVNLPGLLPPNASPPKSLKRNQLSLKYRLALASLFAIVLGLVISQAIVPMYFRVYVNKATNYNPAPPVPLAGELANFTGHNQMIESVKFSLDNSAVFTGSADHSVRMWDINNKKEIRSFTGHSNVVSSIDCDGVNLVSGSWDQTVREWNIQTGQLIRTYTGHTGPVACVAISPYLTYIASGSSDNTIRLWDRLSGNTIRQFSGHIRGTLAIAFSPDGKKLVSGGYDNYVRVWDVESGKLLAEYSKHNQPVLSIAVLHNNSGYQNGNANAIQQQPGKNLIIVSGSMDGSIQIYDSDQQAIKRSITAGGWVRSLAITKNNSFLLAGLGDGTIRIWSIRDGKEVKNIRASNAHVISIALNSNDSLVLSGDEAGVARLWSLNELNR